MKNKLRRRHHIARRILLVIDQLAPLRFGATAKEVADAVNEILGETYHVRTYSRDLNALVECGLAKVCTRRRAMRLPVVEENVFVLNLVRSEGLQEAALVVDRAG